MFKINVPQFVIEYSRKFVQQCNLGNRGDGSDGTIDQQQIGVIAQNMALLAIGQPLLEPSFTHDGGVDFIAFDQRIDIKTMGRSVDVSMNYVNNLVASQIKLNADAFIFTSYNTMKKELTVCGWIPKNLFLQRAVLHNKDDYRIRSDNSKFQLKADMYEINNSSICNVSTNWPEMWVEIGTWASAKKILTFTAPRESA